jgi:hypothetical protein
MLSTSKLLRNPPAVTNTDPYFKNTVLLLNDTGTNGAQNNTFLDSSVNNFTVTRNGNTTQGSFTPYEPTGYWSNYFGTGNYLSTPSSTAFDFSTGDFTIEAWVFISGNSPLDGSNRRYANILSNSTTSLVPGFFIKGDSTTTGTGLDIYNNTVTVGVSGTIPQNQWNHVAVCRSGTSVYFWLNGAQLGTTQTFSGAFGSSSVGCQIGRTICTGYTFDLIGNISNLRVVKGSAVYTAAFTPSILPLTAITNTSLLTCQDNRFKDNSSNNFTITANGSPTVSPFNPLPPAADYATPAFGGTGYWNGIFNGSSQYLTFPTNSAFALPADFTIECWFYSSTFTGEQTLIDLRGAFGTVGFLCFVKADKCPAVFKEGATTILTSTVAVTAGAWNHIAFVRSGTTFTVYVNGVSGGSVTDSTSWAAPNTTGRIGSNYSSANFVNGLLSNFRVVKGTAVYTSTFTPPTTPLTAISGTSLLTCQNSTFIDNSSNAFTITAVGSPTTSRINPFNTYLPAQYGGSMYFDGAGDYLTAPANTAYAFGTGDFTIEFWAYLNTNPTNAMVVTTRLSNGGATGTWGIYSNASNKWNFQEIVVGATTNLSSATSAVTNQWTHLAVTRSGTTLRIFINGVLDATGSSSTNFNNSTYPLYVASDTFNIYQNSYISNLRVVKGTAVYTSTFTPPTAPVSAISGTSLLLNGTNAGIYDATTINDLETVGNAQVSTTQKKWGGSSMYFDGSGDYLTYPASNVFAFGTGNFTVEYWVYSSSWATAPTVVDGRNTGVSNNGYADYFSSSGYFSLYLGSATVFTSSSAIPTSTWTHIAVSRSGTSLRVFIDGVQNGSTVTNSIDFSDTNLLIGVNRGTAAGTINTAFFNGYIEDLRITKGIARYTANFTAPTAPFPTR